MLIVAYILDFHHHQCYFKCDLCCELNFVVQLVMENTASIQEEIEDLKKKLQLTGYFNSCLCTD